eukprot:gnl/Dysnectes_brevis/6289_a9648_366.p1 GENE.gnl/Dysnectes_brevis/6289_a9648_366~~gnl/Dysnectes_brevis/6289_a9648_366.p1  ORF type:complete len:447 (-),score=110.66 gnl/Dysnectes_brevis/6289_a9648_366:18-1358(-)
MSSVPSFEKIIITKRFRVTTTFKSRGRSTDGPQFDAIYRSRIHKLKPLVKEYAASIWPTSTILSQITDVEQSQRTDVVIIGALVRQFKPRETLEDFNDIDHKPPPRMSGFTSVAGVDDPVFIEDMMTRIRIEADSEAKIDIYTLLTGRVVALRGRISEGGSFRVMDCCGPLPPPVPRPLPTGLQDGKPLIALASGLRVGDPRARPVSLLVDALTGLSPALGGVHSQLGSLILAGCNVCAPEETPSGLALFKDGKPHPMSEITSLVSPVIALDHALLSLSALTTVLMPGITDPAPRLWPQPPLSPVLLPSAGRSSGVLTAGNPCVLGFNDGTSTHRFLGSDGVAVLDGMAAKLGSTPLDIMAEQVSSLHVCPTAPQLMDCAPVRDDCFVIKKVPRVFFAGNQSAAGAKLISVGDAECLLLSVPEWSSTCTVLVLNPRTLAVKAYKLA